MNKQAIFDKFVEFMGRFAEIRAVAALRDGFIMTTPFTVCGSVFLLIANLPIPGYPEFMANLFGKDWTAPLNAVAGGTFSVLALIAVLAITYKYVEAEGCDAIMASILSLSTFLIVLPPTVMSKGGEAVGDVIPKAWAGSNGVITAILVSFAVSAIFCYCEKHHLGIKMPSTVPSGVTRAFEALTPAFLLFLGGSVIYGVFHYVGATTFPEFIFKVLQTPLQGLSDTLIGGSIIAALQSILFWAGIHGPNVVGGVVSPILIANSLDNQALLDAGQQLMDNPAAKIITCQVNDVFIKSGGCGLTFGLLIASWLCSKSSQMKSLTKLATVPGLFNINEPIIFGLPIVFNPFLLVPFVLVPLFALFITYGAIAVGFMAPFSAVQVPWTTPPILAGLLLDGWQGAVIQIINLVMATAVYLPFVRAQDRHMLAEEKADAASEDVSTTSDIPLHCG
ncbi:MAG: PTS transporter subunit EIIC [Selenomonas sp.]|uniref:PTS sugar transporter subunit IIC n=1 Tax=Selenomonas sp. TaxID=2053611 RepID=UPI0025E9A59B|nr:PTS transporter subunit EIIC [Selenomonas sp.]MCR5439457.1 PTS transporter subunit EIIC [Selenomonas sp.]